MRPRLYLLVGEDPVDGGGVPFAPARDRQDASLSYKLTRPPRDYTVGEILMLTEGNLAIVSCLLDDDAPCMRKSECLTLPMWEKFDRMTHDFFFGITLADLMNGEIPT